MFQTKVLTSKKSELILKSILEFPNLISLKILELSLIILGKKLFFKKKST
jgi:hypothetical protein